MSQTVLLLCLISVPFVLGEGQCELPRVDRDINWDAMKGDLFEIIDVPDKYDATFNCKILRDVRRTSTGFAMTIHDESSNAEPAAVEFIRQGTGYYQMQSPAVRVLNQYLENVDNPDEVTAAEEETSIMTARDHLIYTVQDKFLIGLLCDENEQKIIWIESLDRNPTAADIILIHNELASVGKGWGEVQLVLTGCTHPK